MRQAPAIDVAGHGGPPQAWSAYLDIRELGVSSQGMEAVEAGAADFRLLIKKALRFSPQMVKA